MRFWVSLGLALASAACGPGSATGRVASRPSDHASAPAPSNSAAADADSAAPEAETIDEPAPASEWHPNEPPLPVAATGRRECALAGAPIALPVPPTTETLAPRRGARPRARLVERSSRPNGVTDTDAWFARNGLSDPIVRSGDPLRLPATCGGHRLSLAAPGADRTVAFYGPLVVVLDPSGETTAALDLAAYLAPLGGLYSDVSARYGVVVDGVLYVSHAHRTYATASGGANGYITAIDVATGRMIWRSRPLVANAESFVVTDRVIVTGYGFTEEKDWLYVLDRATGARLARLRVESGPSYILERGGTIYVRTYDHDIEVGLSVN